MFSDEARDVRQAAVKALGKIATPEDKDKIFEMTKDKEIEVNKTAVEAFLKISEPEDNEYLLDFLAEKGQGWSEKNLKYFKLLSILDKKLYCPYYEEKNEN